MAGDTESKNRRLGLHHSINALFICYWNHEDILVNELTAAFQALHYKNITFDFGYPHELTETLGPSFQKHYAFMIIGLGVSDLNSPEFNEGEFLKWRDQNIAAVRNTQSNIPIFYILDPITNSRITIRIPPPVYELSPDSGPHRTNAAVILEHLQYLSLLPTPGDSAPPQIHRTIEFAPQHKRAGIDLLSYFSDFLLNRHPNIDAAVRIEQHGNKVTLDVKTDDKSIETVEATLTEYGEVLIGNRKLEEVLTSPNEMAALKLEMRLAAAKAEQHLMLYEQEKRHNEQLNLQIVELHKQLASALTPKPPSPPITINSPVTVTVTVDTEATATQQVNIQQLAQAIKALQSDVEKADEETITQTARNQILSTLGSALEDLAKDRVKEALGAIKEIATDLAPLAGRASVEMLRGIWG